MAKKLCVSSMCIACNICVHEAPNTFVLAEDPETQSMISIVTNQSGDTPEQIQKAIDMCPVMAISWEEDK